MVQQCRSYEKHTRKHASPSAPLQAALANSVRWLSVFNHALFSLCLFRLHLLWLLPLPKTGAAVLLSLSRKITPWGN